jgi:hypothetical protein
MERYSNRKLSKKLTRACHFLVPARCSRLERSDSCQKKDFEGLMASEALSVQDMELKQEPLIGGTL